MSKNEVAALVNCDSCILPYVEQLTIKLNYLDAAEAQRCRHQNDLLQEREFQPVAWKTVEGEINIPITLLEAVTEADAGNIWFQSHFLVEPTDLYEDWRHKQGIATTKIVMEFMASYPNIKPSPQRGDPTYYARRTPADSELDTDKTLADLFDQLRIADNQNFPAYFYHHGQRYRLEVYHDDD